MKDHDEIGRRMREALGDGSPEPGLRSRLIASLPDDPRPNRLAEWAMGATALLLSIAMVGGLLYVGGAFRAPKSGHPAGQFRGNVTLLGVGDLRCRLPIEFLTGDGFISFPDGALSTDPTAISEANVAQHGSPYSPGGYQRTYDSVAGKWLAVPPSSISPDQRSYAYISTTTGVPGTLPAASVHTVDARGGHDRSLWQGTGGGQILGWTATGIYFSLMTAVLGGREESVLYGLDPTSGVARRIAALNTGGLGGTTGGQPSAQFTFLGNGAVWGIAFPAPPPVVVPTSEGWVGSSKYYRPNQIIRLDLKDGSRATWFTAPDNESVFIAGVDGAGNPILSQMTLPVPPQKGAPPQSYKSKFSPPRFSILTGINQTTPLGDGSDVMFRPQSFFSDSHGTWIGTPNGSIYLLSKSGLRKVAVVPGGLVPSPSFPPGYGGKGSQTPPPGFTGPTPPPGYSGVPVRIGGPCS